MDQTIRKVVSAAALSITPPVTTSQVTLLEGVLSAHLSVGKDCNKCDNGMHPIAYFVLEGGDFISSKCNGWLFYASAHTYSKQRSSTFRVPNEQYFFYQVPGSGSTVLHMLPYYHIPGDAIRRHSTTASEYWEINYKCN